MWSDRKAGSLININRIGCAVHGTTDKRASAYQFYFYWKFHQLSKALKSSQRFCAFSRKNNLIILTFVHPYFVIVFNPDWTGIFKQNVPFQKGISSSKSPYAQNCTFHVYVKYGSFPFWNLARILIASETLSFLLHFLDLECLMSLKSVWCSCLKGPACSPKVNWLKSIRSSMYHSTIPFHMKKLNFARDDAWSEKTRPLKQEKGLRILLMLEILRKSPGKDKILWDKSYLYRILSLSHAQFVPSATRLPDWQLGSSELWAPEGNVSDPLQDFLRLPRLFDQSSDFTPLTLRLTPWGAGSVFRSRSQLAQQQQAIET